MAIYFSDMSTDQTIRRLHSKATSSNFNHTDLDLPWHREIVQWSQRPFTLSYCIEEDKGSLTLHQTIWFSD